jgi:hypothetical protein
MIWPGNPTENDTAPLIALLGFGLSPVAWIKKGAKCGLSPSVVHGYAS